MNPVLTHRQRFTIRSHEIDPLKQVSPPALIRLMQEASMQHVLQLKLSVWDLEPKGISWVLMRQRLQVGQLPRLGEEIEVYTYPSGFERVFTHRDFRIYNAAGDEIAQASTTWLLMNTGTRRMARIPEELLAYNALLPHPTGYLQRTADSLPSFIEAIQTRHFRVGWYDLDFNFHLTNSKYVEFMLESTDMSLLNNATLQEMDILFQAECTWNTDIIAETAYLEENSRLHRLLRAEDGKELARARSVWQKS
jgi:medium-chain acyl-[acyl-carrier-protein] hydrolase